MFQRARGREFRWGKWDVHWNFIVSHEGSTILQDVSIKLDKVTDGKDKIALVEVIFLRNTKDLET